MNARPSDAAIFAIQRPHPRLWRYYLLASFAIPPLFPVVVLPMWFRYYTMRYRFTAEGISMSWGILFRREVIIQYARIQDIHLRSNIVERWLGLARVLVQTASGNASAEMTLEGILEYEALRDFLYDRMRGVKDRHHGAVASLTSAASPHPATAPESDELAATLREVANELRLLRLALPPTSSPPPPNGPHHV